jgi:hypothetical protein
MFGAEEIILCRRYDTNQPQIFILGLPRSGTTLVYQYIVHRLNVVYFTNGVGRYCLAPCITTCLQRRIHGAYRSDFTSQFGKVTNPLGPREAGSFWLRYFDKDAYTTFEELAPPQAERLRNTIACLQHIFADAAFVNKNVKHLLRLDALSKIFPNSYFIVVNRDLPNLALSLFRARLENTRNRNEWWSVRPANFDELKTLPITEQITQQVIRLKRKLQHDLVSIPSDRIFHLVYENFCKQPENLINHLKTEFSLAYTTNSPIDSFAVSINKPRTNQEEELLEILHKEHDEKIF